MNSQKQCAFLTLEKLAGFFIYDELAIVPLVQLGWQVDTIPWTQPDTDWDDYEIVVIRSTWDYQDRVEEFLQVLERIDRSRARLENPLAIVRWNLNKSYLRDLQERGIPIVPTHWFDHYHDTLLTRAQDSFGAEEIIIKPVIGANADATFRLAAGTPTPEWDEFRAMFQSRPYMVQPFVPAIVNEGEYSLFYFAGEYSHCILKKPSPGDFRVQEEHGGRVEPVHADSALRAAGRKVIDAMGSRLLYARVDLVRAPAGTPWLMELELIEPSLYFSFDPESPERFARALDGMYARMNPLH